MKFIRRYVLSSLIGLVLLFLVNRVTEIFITTSGGLYENKFPNFQARLLPELKTHPLAFSFKPEPLLACAFFLGVIVLVIASRDTRTYRHREEFGSSKEGTLKDLEPFAAPKGEKFDQNIILGWKAYMWVKNNYKNPKYQRAKNVFLVGGTGAWKTTSYNIPNLSQMNASYVITDPKLEIYHKTGQMMKDNKYEVKILDLIHFKNTDQFNPFVYINSEETLQDMINLLIKATDGENEKRGEPFWDNSEKLLLSALFSFLYYNYRGYEGLEGNGQLPTLADIGDLIRNLERTNPEVPSIVELMFDDFEEYFGSDCPAVLDFHSFKNYKGETRASVVSMPTARFRMFTLPRLREMTSRDTLELDKMGTRKQVLYIGLSDLSDTYNFLSNMVFTLLFQITEEVADNIYGGALPVPIRLILEEFPSIGAIPNILKAIAVLRGRGMSFEFTAQNYDQLKRVYKDTWEEILGACDSLIYMAGATTKLTKEKFSELAGKQTIGKKSEGKQFGGHGGGSQNTDSLGRDVYMIDEIEQSNRLDALIKITGDVPIVKVKKYNSKKHPRAKEWAKSKNDPRWYEAVRYVDDKAEIDDNIAKNPDTMECLEANLSEVA